MKLKKGESFYLLLSIILLLLIFGLYFLVSRSYSKKGADVEVAPTHVTSSSSSSSDHDSTKLETDLKDLEDNPNPEDLKTVQKEVDKLSDKTKKASFQERLNIVEAQLSLENAQANPTSENIQLAQDAISQVQTASKKTDLQSQLNALSQGQLAPAQNYAPAYN